MHNISRHWMWRPYKQQTARRHLSAAYFIITPKICRWSEMLMLLLRIPVQQQEIRSPTSIAASAEFRVSMDTLDWVVIDSLTNKSVEVQLMTDTHPEGDAGSGSWRAWGAFRFRSEVPVCTNLLDVEDNSFVPENGYASAPEEAKKTIPRGAPENRTVHVRGVLIVTIPAFEWRKWAAAIVNCCYGAAKFFPRPEWLEEGGPKRTGMNRWKGSRFGTGSTRAGDPSVKAETP